MNRELFSMLALLVVLIVLVVQDRTIEMRASRRAKEIRYDGMMQETYDDDEY